MAKIVDEAYTQPVLYVLKQLYDALEPWKHYSRNPDGQRYYMANYEYLSYVKRDGDKEREPYYLLKMLGAKRVKHEDKKTGKYLESLPEITIDIHSNVSRHVESCVLLERVSNRSRKAV